LQQRQEDQEFLSKNVLQQFLPVVYKWQSDPVDDAVIEPMAAGALGGLALDAAVPKVTLKACHAFPAG